MKLTKEIIVNNYKLYNKLYFNNKLNLPKIIWLNGKIPYGKFICNKRKSKHTIGISRFHNEWSENFLKEVIVHEMVHQYVYDVLYGFKYTLFQHGLRFHIVKWYIKKKYNLII